MKLWGLGILGELLVVRGLPRAVRVQMLFGSSFDVGHRKASHTLRRLGGVTGLWGCVAGVAELEIYHPGCPLFLRESLQVSFDVGLKVHDEG